ncbi:3-ketoacyl-CoA synthase 11-like [Rhodamnia argentea]|uniref:3-ketoacyl-CoA synthase n=1 Tax=Rhodamnia argentea TaxID=178133 RepID=A0A8B8NN34_9MYRT|nr:3-ketoacyl-CoA synthase 11-like [Rhodamnia argentea]
MKLIKPFFRITSTTFLFVSTFLLLSAVAHSLSSFVPFGCLAIVVLSCYCYSRPTPVFLIGYSCFKPSSDRKCTYVASESLVRRSRRFSPESEEFMRKIYLKSGLGDETYGPPFMFRAGYEEARLESAVQEAREGIFSAVDSLLAKTAVHPLDIDLLIVTCGSFSPSPSLSSLIVNHCKLRPDVKVYNLSGMGCSSGVLSIDLAAKILRHGGNVRCALVVITESISLNWYFGDNRSMLVTNCIFRVGCAAALLTNDPARRPAAKFELVRSLRTHHGADDRAYRAAFQEEDDEGNTGIALTKDLIRAATTNLGEHIKILAPWVLPPSQLASYACSALVSALSRRYAKPAVPDFTTSFEHICIHTGGRAVIEQVGRVLQLSEEATEPARMSLHRFGNTSSSLVFYELAYLEAKRRIERGDRVWMLAFGTGFKVGSLVWRSLRSSGDVEEEDNPWSDCVYSYPVSQVPGESYPVDLHSKS